MLRLSSLNAAKNNQTVNVSLQEDATSLEEIVFSASRRKQKVQEAPASVSIITPKDILVFGWTTESRFRIANESNQLIDVH